ncbi:hypothetical protein K438DRAFT_1972634 [Mycena galopus ATCC 62051]|nr:hypothetical protein K438DRAFT_1972634 [Mycena galopus ATCC 62051]
MLNWNSSYSCIFKLNSNLKDFRERQRTLFPGVKLSALDLEEPELTAVQIPSYLIKHRVEDALPEMPELSAMETKLRCSQADHGIFAVQAATLALSATNRARQEDYRGQAGITCMQRSIEKAHLAKTFEIMMYNTARAALVTLGYMAKDAKKPYPPLTWADTRRKETHLHRVKGDSRLFDGTAWYLQSGAHGTQLSKSTRDLTSLDTSAHPSSSSDIFEAEMQAGTQILKRKAAFKPHGAPKRVKDIVPEKESTSEEEDDGDEDKPQPSETQSGKSKSRRSAEKTKKKKKNQSDGWIWLEGFTGRDGLDDSKLAAYKRESERVQWFRAEAEMYRWLEQYERKHAEFMRVIARFGRDALVWHRRAEALEGSTSKGAETYARNQAAMYERLQNNAKVIFKSEGAHHDWVSATDFHELARKIDEWRDKVFKWMDELDIHRAYKDF